VQVPALPKGARIEIEAVAMIDQDMAADEGTVSDTSG